MTKYPEAVPANQDQNQVQDKKNLSKAEQMNLLIKDLKDTAIQSEKDDILGKMLSLFLGDKKSKSGEGDVDGNSLKTREEKGANSDDEQKMMMMALALIFGAMAIALTGGAAGAAIIGVAPAMGVLPDLMKMGKDFLGKSEKDLDGKESINFGKSFLAFLLADKVKDNILGVGERFFNGDNNIVKSIGKYIESLKGMGDEDKKKEIDSLKTMVRGNVSLLEGKGADKSDEKTGPNSNEADKKFNAIFAQFEAMISKPKEDLEESKLISSLIEIRVGDAIVSIESTTTKKVKEVEGEGSKTKGASKDVPSPASSARKDGGGLPRVESAVLLGRDASSAERR